MSGLASSAVSFPALVSSASSPKVGIRVQWSTILVLLALPGSPSYSLAVAQGASFVEKTVLRRGILCPSVSCSIVGLLS